MDIEEREQLLTIELEGVLCRRQNLWFQPPFLFTDFTGNGTSTFILQAEAVFSSLEISHCSTASWTLEKWLGWCTRSQGMLSFLLQWVASRTGGKQDSASNLLGNSAQPILAVAPDYILFLNHLTL